MAVAGKSPGGGGGLRRPCGRLVLPLAVAVLLALPLASAAPQTRRQAPQQEAHHQPQRRNPLLAAAWSWVQARLPAGLVLAAQRLYVFPTAATRVIDGVQLRRLSRGDTQGAARLQALRAWTNMIGVHRSLAALAVDVATHRGVISEVLHDWAPIFERLQRADGWPEALMSESAAVATLARKTLRRIGRAFQGGAVAQLLADLHAEFSQDSHFAADVTDALLPGGSGPVLAQGMESLLQQAWDTAAELFRAPATSRRPRTRSTRRDVDAEEEEL